MKYTCRKMKAKALYKAAKEKRITEVLIKRVGNKDKP